MRLCKVEFLAVCVVLVLTALGPAQADVLYRLGDKSLFDGRYGPIAAAQARANAALVACGKPGSISVDGRFGQGTRAALMTLAQCPAFQARLTSDEDARRGVLTSLYWDALIGEAPPTVDDRARTLMLTYEATDYTHLEWNYCQSRPLYNPSGGQPFCFSNDPRSYLTWGPNGATAGGGREVQLILQAVDASSPAIIDTGFGKEAGAVRRTFKLVDNPRSRDLETYLCGVWANPLRRQAWKAGFEAIGRVPAVRSTFDRLYRSSSLDGGKIATFYRAYTANNLIPTEVDYAFFKDRSAHTSPSFLPIQRAIADAIGTDPSLPRWKVRQAIALKVRPGNQREDRLGRDVSFYIDGAESSLSTEERRAWMMRGRLRASDVGLSDRRPMATFTPGPALPTGIEDPVPPTDSERDACPQAVLSTRHPNT